MIHIATVHWNSDRWIDIQLRHLAANLHSPHRVYASLVGVASEQGERFFLANVEEGGRHHENLNALAARVLDEAAPEDLLVFMDGDAFPIADLDGALPALLERHPLAAVRRDENLQDPQPHPSFCVTTAGFWHEIGGDWSPGYQWRNARGDAISDVGGNLLGVLRERGIEWRPLLRTNARELHPILFGVYGDLVYHHGAGFRGHSFSRREEVDVLREVERAGGNRRDRTGRYLELKREQSRRNQELATTVLERIEADPDFATKLFLAPDSAEGAGARSGL
jgi:hypothetical protein